MSKFVERLLHVCEKSNTLLCVGLDPDPAVMPITDVVEFNKAIVDATHDLVCAYKPNLAFYEARGSKGIREFEQTVQHIRDVAPNVMILADAKRGDVLSTNAQYAKALFETWNVDATTVHAYIGGGDLEPFLIHEDKAVFVLCRTSNKGALELQDIKVQLNGAAMLYYQAVATRAVSWNSRGNVGLVVGATYPKELEEIRGIAPDMPILLPGVGAQAGALEASVEGGTDAFGRNLIVSSSRGVLYASSDPGEFADAGRGAAETLRSQINSLLDQKGLGWS